MNMSEKNANIVEAIVALAHGLEIKVTAEGVETAEQLTHLQRLKCNYAQGYFFSKPLSVDCVENWLKNLSQEAAIKSV
jgi:diguanylate cyclase